MKLTHDPEKNLYRLDVDGKSYGILAKTKQELNSVFSNIAYLVGVPVQDLINLETQVS